MVFRKKIFLRHIHVWYRVQCLVQFGQANGKYYLKGTERHLPCVVPAKHPSRPTQFIYQDRSKAELILVLVIHRNFTDSYELQVLTT